MDSISAMTKGIANQDKESKVFDWNKAAELIKQFQPDSAEAGLIEDWNWTGGAIYKGGKPVPAKETYTYLASTWATPVLITDNGSEHDCWKWESEVPDWNAETYWPESALDILGGS